ncbi:hypothetical protein Hanom_Chr03g00245041 [Helianthus anomalus]
MKSLQNREPLSIKNLPVKHNNPPTISGLSFGVGNPNSEINTSLGEVSGGDGVTGVGSGCGAAKVGYDSGVAVVYGGGLAGFDGGIAMVAWS